MINVLGQRSGGDPEKIAEVKRWAADALDLPEAASLMVAQLECAEPGCPEVETVVAAFEPGRAPRQWKILKPISEVTCDDVRAAIRAVSSET
jgi:hypothetical protein